MKCSTQMLLGTAATLMPPPLAFMTPMALRSMALKIFDPVGLSDGANPTDIKKQREAELKHGRVAMLASLAVLVAEEYHPFFMGPDYIRPAVDHFQEISVQFPEVWAEAASNLCRVGSDLANAQHVPKFWVFSLLGMALVEYNTIAKAYETPSAVTGEGGLKDEYSPRDLGFDPLGLKPKTEEDLVVMQTKELNNGRLAMIGIAGMLVQQLVNPANILG